MIVFLNLYKTDQIQWPYSNCYFFSRDFVLIHVEFFDLCAIKMLYCFDEPIINKADKSHCCFRKNQRKLAVSHIFLVYFVQFFFRETDISNFLRNALKLIIYLFFRETENIFWPRGLSS